MKLTAIGTQKEIDILMFSLEADCAICSLLGIDKCICDDCETKCGQDCKKKRACTELMKTSENLIIEIIESEEID